MYVQSPVLLTFTIGGKVVHVFLLLYTHTGAWAFLIGPGVHCTLKALIHAVYDMSV